MEEEGSSSSFKRKITSVDRKEANTYRRPLVVSVLYSKYRFSSSVIERGL